VLLKPEQPLDSKVKSIAFAIRNFRQHHDALTILDADNLVHPAFFETVNRYFQKGFEVVQCDFKPKNKDTDFARMDAVGDTFNFFMDREARMEVGLSAAIWGSGISMKLALYQEISFENVVGGFDKLLQAHLVARTKQIAFAKDAVLYDEKITAGTALQQQRTRWINAHFKYMPLAAKALMKGVLSANFNLLYYGYVNMRPPLFLLAGSAVLFAAANIWLNPFHSLCWLIALFLFFAAFAAIVFLKNENKQGMQRTLLMLPAFAWRQALALLKIKKAGKSFLPTTHNKVVFIHELTSTPAEPKLGAEIAS
jgi:cellulose synthase/poly-beta-1,6-N-acetylglucosamine synthase-like glycosyltransferase